MKSIKPLSPESVEEQPPADHRSRIQAEVEAIQQGRELKDLSVPELREIKAKYLELKRILKPESFKTISLEKAKEIMGQDMLGSEAIKKAFGFEMDESDIPPIPYTSEQLEKAKELQEQLILRVSRDGQGKPMTMERINQLVKMDPKKEGKLLSGDWHKDEDFFKNRPLKTEWKLVGKEFIPDSTNKNYIHQTRILRQYLKGANSLTEQEEAGCSDKVLKELSDDLGLDWSTQEVVDQKQYDLNWKIVARKLSELAINMNHRRSPAEIIYDQVLNFKTGRGRGKLETNYDWSNAVSSDGRLVLVGHFGADGARVSGWGPGNRDGYLGAVPLR